MCNFCSKFFLSKIFLVVVIIISLGLIFGTIKYLKYLPRIIPTSTSVSRVNVIEISADSKSILNAETKEIIFTIADTRDYLKNSDYLYNPDTFQITNAKYEGECFSSASLSNSKDRIVFSTGCLHGDLPHAWVGFYSISTIEATTGICAPNTECVIPNSAKIKFIIAGNGKNFIWLADDKTITYEANLGLSGMMETRTINSGQGEILENNSPAANANDFDIQKEVLDSSNSKIISKKITLPIKNYSINNRMIRITGTDQSVHLDKPILPILDLDKETLPPTPITEIKVVFDTVNSKSTTIKNKIPIGDIGIPTGGEIKGKFAYDGFWPPELHHNYSVFTIGAEAKEVGFYAHPVQYNSKTGETKIWTTMIFDVIYSL